MTVVSIIVVLLGVVAIGISTVMSPIVGGKLEWAGIGLALVGLALEMPGALQRRYGRPRLVREYDKYVESQESALIVFLRNPPVRKDSFVGKLGVKRDAISSLAASFRIFEKARVVIPIMQARIYCDDQPTEAGRWRVDLAPTFSASTSIIVARWDGGKKKAIVAGDRTKRPVELSAGLYGIEMLYLVDGQPEKESKEFVVGESGDDLTWIEGQN